MKNRWIALCALLLIPVTGFAGGEVINGGNTIHCWISVPTNDYYGYYSLDWFATKAWQTETLKLVPVKTESGSFARIQAQLERLDAGLAKSFAEFTAAYAKSDVFSVGRRWVKSDFPLKVVLDPEFDEIVPSNCTAPAGEGPAGPNLILTVIRQTDARGILYRYHGWVFSLLDPQQKSFMVVHEWLWDFFKSGKRLRTANFLLHSNRLEQLSPQEFTALWRETQGP